MLTACAPALPLQAQFAAYIPDGLTVEAFCATNVDPMGREADHVECIALATWMGVPVRIEYLGTLRMGAARACSAVQLRPVPLARSDQSGGPLNHYDMPEGAAPANAALPTLLYRPGHFDVLYPK